MGPRGVLSGIAKSEVSGLAIVTETGLYGDEQGDTRRHGGADKAIHHYPFDHYSSWKRELGELPILHRPGAFGENISTMGVREDGIAVGDIFQLGSSIVEVSQGRQPCWRLNERFDRIDMSRQTQASGRTGWYYRVLEPGFCEPYDRLLLVERRSPEWTISRIWRALYVETLNHRELEGIAELGSLATNWRDLAARRLSTKAVEDWNKRLDGEPSQAMLYQIVSEPTADTSSFKTRNCGHSLDTSLEPFGVVTPRRS